MSTLTTACYAIFFCQAFRESRNIKEVLFFLCSFNFYYVTIFFGSSQYCDSIFKMQKNN